MHAAIDFCFTHPEAAAQWHAHSNTLVVLAARDELALHWLAVDAESAGLRVARFHEPDLGGALTAVAFEPSAGRLLSHLRLALSSPSRTAKGGEKHDHPRAH
jgi:hypothetical protein